MRSEKTPFALLFGNRGFFPASHQARARRELPGVLKRLGHETLMLGARATRHGAVETPRNVGAGPGRLVVSNSSASLTPLLWAAAAVAGVALLVGIAKP